MVPSLWSTCPPQAGASCLSLSALRYSPTSLSDPFWKGKSPDSSNTTSFKLFYSSLNPFLSLKIQAFGNLNSGHLFFFFSCHFLPKVQVMGHPYGLTTVGKQREKAGAFLQEEPVRWPLLPGREEAGDLGSLLCLQGGWKGLCFLVNQPELIDIWVLLLESLPSTSSTFRG